jgi:hypothetical protein
VSQILVLMDSVPDLESVPESVQDLESTHGISWAGEWLPMELWFKVFQYYCISQPIPADTDAFDVLRSHPTIAEILDRFLPYLGGFTYTELLELTGGYSRNPIPFIHLCVRDSNGKFLRWMRKDASVFCLCNLYVYAFELPELHFEVRKGPYGQRIMTFYPDHICIHTPGVNSLLPWGCFVTDMSESNGLILPEIFYKLWIPKPPSEWKPEGGNYKYRIHEIRRSEIRIIYKDLLYIPPWRPR